MASKYTPETDTMPHLVVKIVGSKQVKYFVEGPNKEKVFNEGVAEEVPTAMSCIPENESIHSGKTTPSESPLNVLNEDISIYKELQQIRDRQCATAPCGDRSLSYIHVKKSLSAVTDLCKATQPQESLSGGKEEGELKERELEERLLRAVREELRGWGGAPIRNIECDVLKLDTSRAGTIHQSQLSYAFLRNEVPLKLPTLGHLFHTFSKDMCPDEVDYGKLLHFLREATAEDDQKKIKAEEGSQPVSRTSLSACTAASSAPTNGRTSERWMERFHEMERALNLSDTQNTGFLDKDKARRLIQNYNVILDLSLSPLKIAEATRTIQSEGKIHLASALRLLRGL
ncbi:hypothetical protein ACEWY4_014238 [Coilia grayii]|uniref:EF-hand domain-containing protein n=1 Tax=Coilia grayii TaxID=363190 RepID=A0ABD1JRQ0_9TELE